MEFINLPDDVLVYILKNFINIKDLFALSCTCKKFNLILQSYNIWSKFKDDYPIIDLNYPYGYEDYNVHSALYHKLRTDKYKIKFALKWKSKKYSKQSIYKYKKKMMPFLQIDEQDSSLFLTDANRIVNLKLDEKTYHYTTGSNNDTKKFFDFYPLGVDVKGFAKKDDYFYSFCHNTIIGCIINQTSYPLGMEESETENYAFKMHKEKNMKIFNEFVELHSPINAIDFSIKARKLIYGCKNGLLKMHNINDEVTNTEPIRTIELKDRILKTVLSPTNESLAVGTAGVEPHSNYLYSPLRLFNTETFEEITALMPSNEKPFRKGAGILALSFIDENTLSAAGYDTFIRVFDLRTNKCVQSLEEPQDMAIYSVCCSKENGILSGNDHFCLIRYWDRRTAKIVQSFEAADAKSPIYSLACTTEGLFAGWESGVTEINFT